MPSTGAGALVGIGVDLVEVAQMRALLAGGAGKAFVKQTFRPAEIAHAAGEAERFAALFAVKEATFKAFRTGWVDGLCVETSHDDAGAPILLLHGELRSLAEELGGVEPWVSLSTTAHAAVAMVVVMRR